MTKRLKDTKELEDLHHKLAGARDETRPTVVVCGGTGCHGYGCEKVIEAFEKEITAKGLENKVTLRVTGCHGFCERGPLALIQPKGVFYQRIDPKDVTDILVKTVLGDEIIDKLLYTLPGTKDRVAFEHDVPFYAKQNRLIFGNNQRIDPTSLEDYIAIGGYRAMAKALTSMEPEKIIDEVKKSGLRGRGGGGFPTGRKWESCRKAKGEPKYIMCNADEGDPGAYMDRSVLEGNPHSVLEGMVIGAFAIGSHEGYIYVRNEYPLAVKNIHIAIDQARAMGLLGKDILGTGFDFDVTVCRGGGAFVCGESTALMASLEGKIGEPRAKYVHTVDAGLWGKPSNLNNVETWANIPFIINRGAEWYAKIGTEGSKGTKIFSLVGKINNTGLVEAPMGMTLREIIYDIGGGIPKGRKFKAVQTGGPSGGCLPESLLDLLVDFDALTKAGSMMGSGGLIVMDEYNCMVDVARYFIHFLAEESCGKCVPCREGVKHMLEILNRICEGKGREGDIETLEEMSETVLDASLCALGGTAPNPVLSTIKYFRDEYEAHIKEKKCPGKTCKNLITYMISDRCIGCQKCYHACPVNVISGEKKKLHVIDQAGCITCGACFDVCPVDAVDIIPGKKS